jgi:hypothetical protein
MRGIEYHDRREMVLKVHHRAHAVEVATFGPSSTQRASVGLWVPGTQLLGGATMTPDEAREVAFMLVEAANEAERQDELDPIYEDSAGEREAED